MAQCRGCHGNPNPGDNMVRGVAQVLLVFVCAVITSAAVEVRVLMTRLVRLKTHSAAVANR